MVSVLNRLPLATHAYTTAAGTVGKATPVGFEPTRGDPIGLAGRRLNRSAKVSLSALSWSMQEDRGSENRWSVRCMEALDQ